MGKLVTVKSGYSYVLLPDKAGSGGQRNYSPGDQVILSDAEYTALTTTPSQAGTAAAITLTTSGLPDPYRKAASSVAGLYASEQATTAAGVTILALGTNLVTGPAGGVTYNAGFLTVPATNAGQGVVGPTSGSASFFRILHKQGATASVAPTGKNWFGNGATTLWPGGTVPTFTATAGALDVFEFVTYDGGATYVNTLTVKGLA